MVGYPEFSEAGRFNAALVFANGQRVGNYRKACLPNYGVFDERRHFEPGSEPLVFTVAGLSFGLSICEDLWQPGPAAAARSAGAEWLLNLNASPYDQTKRARRRQVIRARIAETGLGVAYVNGVGGQDEVVFDGDSQLWSGAGECLWRSPPFTAGLLTPDGGARLARDLPEGDRTIARKSRCDEDDNATALLYSALTTAIRDYVERNGFPRVYLGASGGIDSALTLALAADAVGADKVTAVAMPSRYSAAMSQDDAAQEAAALGAHFLSLPIEPAVSAYGEILTDSFEGTAADLTEENLQARIRGTLLMALANKFGGIVLATGNKSELAVGYSTLYGDMCGGFAPLKDVYKQQVYALARYRNSVSAVIPERVLTRPPSAELRPDQKDADSLPPYDRLDAILAAYIEGEQSVPQLKAAGFDAGEVDQVVRLVRLAEYKRRQAPPGPKVSTCAFGRERRYPITAAYADL